MRKHIATFVAGVIASGLLIAGCGSDSEDADAQQIDKATFVKQANKICERASGQIVGEITSISSRESANPQSDYLETQISIVRRALVPGIEEELEEIRALGVPEEAKQEVQAFLEAYAKAIDEAKADAKAVAEGSFPFEPVELAGTRFGISECPIAPVEAG
ncbi:MAG TPA: hypothetical protein VIS95_05250 [Solirubrobacterales bacterium]